MCRKYCFCTKNVFKVCLEDISPVRKAFSCYESAHAENDEKLFLENVLPKENIEGITLRLGADKRRLKASNN